MEEFKKSINNAYHSLDKTNDLTINKNIESQRLKDISKVENNENKGYSPQIGKTDGLTDDVINKILMVIANSVGEDDTDEVKTKEEPTEATTSSVSAAGAYDTPAFLAKNKGNWKPSKKTTYPGGKFVKVKDKCKNFPYCNQGDMNALTLTEKFVIEGYAKKLKMSSRELLLKLQKNYK